MNSLAIAGCVLVPLAGCCAMTTYFVAEDVRNNNEDHVGDLLGGLVALPIVVFGYVCALLVFVTGLALIVSSVWLDI